MSVAGTLLLVSHARGTQTAERSLELRGGANLTVGSAGTLVTWRGVAKLEAAGYSQVRDIKSAAEGIAVKATKDGKDVSLAVDSSGQVRERK